MIAIRVVDRLLTIIGGVPNRLCDLGHSAADSLRRGMNSIDGAAHDN
jgi:hypothetical protein